jgi:acetyl-CoA acetyltransferase
MDIYARLAREYMASTGATAADFAAVAAKNSVHGSLNPNSQFQSVVSVEEVLESAPIVDPFTLMMCSPVADGAAAAVLMSAKLGACEWLRLHPWGRETDAMGGRTGVFLC